MLRSKVKDVRAASSLTSLSINAQNSRESLLYLQRREILTSSQTEIVKDRITGRPHRVQRPQFCHDNARKYIVSANAGKRAKEVAWPQSELELSRYVKSYGMVLLRARGITQQPVSGLTGGSKYTESHSVVITGIYDVQGVPNYLIFDGDDTVDNPVMGKLAAYAEKLGKAICELTPGEIDGCDAARGLYRLEPCQEFFREMYQDWTTFESGATHRYALVVMTDEPPEKSPTCTLF